VDQPRVQTTGQLVPPPYVNSSPLDDIIRAVIVTQQVMTEFNDAVSKETKIQAITKIAPNGQHS
jgi:hypothetical protein